MGCLVLYCPSIYILRDETRRVVRLDEPNALRYSPFLLLMRRLANQNNAVRSNSTNPIHLLYLCEHYSKLYYVYCTCILLYCIFVNL